MIYCRDNSKFDPVKFRSDLREELSTCYGDESTYDHFNATVEQVLNKHVPLRRNLVGQMMVLL